MTVERIALIGFGEVGQILANDLSETTDCTLTAFDLKFGDSQSAPSRAIAESKADAAPSTERCVRDADLIISAVTAAATVDAAHATAIAIEPDAWFLDLNSASPTSKQRAAEIINARGGRYVEASIMSPIHPKHVGSPILLAGPYAEEFAPLAKTLGFTGAEFYSAEPGKAAAAKLCRSVMIKGIEALITESLLAAQHYGVVDDVIASLDNLLPGVEWREQAKYMISRAVQHGARRAEEMTEAAHTVADAGIDPWMCEATVRRQEQAAAYINAIAETSLSACLAGIRSQMEKEA